MEPHLMKWKTDTAKAGVCNQAILNSLNKAQKQDKFLLQMLANQYLPIKPAEGQKKSQKQNHNTKPQTPKLTQKYCIVFGLFIIFT